MIIKRVGLARPSKWTDRSLAPAAMLPGRALRGDLAARGATFIKDSFIKDRLWILGGPVGKRNLGWPFVAAPSPPGPPQPVASRRGRVVFRARRPTLLVGP